MDFGKVKLAKEVKKSTYKKENEINGLEYLGGKLASGAYSIGVGAYNYVNALVDKTMGLDEYAVKQYRENSSNALSEKLDSQYEANGFMQFTGAVMQDIGQNLARIPLAFVPVVGGVLSGGLAYTGYAGMGEESAVQKTSEYGGKEQFAGLVSGTIDTVLNTIGGKIGGWLPSSTKIVDISSKPLRDTAVSFLKGGASEFAQEFIEAYADVLVDRMTGIDPNASVTFKEALYEGAVGFASGGILGGLGTTARQTKSAIIGSNIKSKGKADSVVNFSRQFMSQYSAKGKFDNEVLQMMSDSLDSYMNAKGNSVQEDVALGNLVLTTEYLTALEQMTPTIDVITNNADKFLNAAKAIDENATVEQLKDRDSQIVRYLAAMDYASNFINEDYNVVKMAQAQEETNKQNIEYLKSQATDEESKNAPSMRHITSSGHWGTDGDFGADGAVFEITPNERLNIAKVGDKGYRLVLEEGDKIGKVTTKDGKVYMSEDEVKNTLQSMRDEFAQLNKDKTEAKEEQKEETKESPKEETKDEKEQAEAEQKQEVLEEKRTYKLTNDVAKASDSLLASFGSKVKEKAKKVFKNIDDISTERRVAIYTMLQSAGDTDESVLKALCNYVSKRRGLYVVFNESLEVPGLSTISNQSRYILIRNGKKAIMDTVTHEIFHSLRGTKTWDRLNNDALEYAIKHEAELGLEKTDLAHYLDRYNQVYYKGKANEFADYSKKNGIQKALKKYDGEGKIQEELAANVLGKKLGTKRMMKLISGYGEGNKFLSAIKSVMKFTSKGDKLNEELAKLESEYMQVMDKAITDDKEQVKKELKELGIDIDDKTDSATMYSLETWGESDYVNDTKRVARELANAIGVDVKKAEKYINDVDSIANYIAENKGRLDYTDTGLSSFVGNVEYGGSFDFNTLCKKRRLLTGTFTEIQKALPNTALTAEEILEIRKMMDDSGLEVSCGKCYVEGSRANMGVFLKEFINLYKKYYPNEWIPTLADINTPDGIESVRINHPHLYEQYEYFWNHYGTLKDGDKNLFASQQKPKLYQMRTEYKHEIIKNFGGENNKESVKEKNRNGGIRLQSFSDFEIVHLLDAMQVLTDMSRVGLNGQAYTKVKEFALAFGNTGLKINLSIDAWGVDENGKLIFNDKEGMPTKDAFKLREQFDKNVGTICCVYDDKQLLAALADDRIDYIIPFHRSQWKKSQYDAIGLPKTTKDYTNQQNEKWLDPSKHTHEYQGRQVKDKCTNYMPNTYWDFSKSGKENAIIYLEKCAEDGKRPKFYKFLTNNNDGTYSLKEDGSTDGYWKLLIDFRMYDKNGVGVPQLPVKPVFNMEEANKMLTSYDGGHTSFPVARGIVEEFVSKYKERNKQTMYSLDSEGNELSKEQQEFFKDSKVRNDNGNLLVVYHGTQNEFTVFEPNEWVTEKSGLTQVKGYFSENEEYSKIYGDTKPYYLNIKNPLYATERWSMTLDEWVKWFNSKGITNIKFDSGIEEDTLKGGDTNKGIEYSFYELIDRGDYWYGDGNVTERIKDAGYDGITWEEEGRAWIPFERNAIKSTSNTNPTTSSDTRYSLDGSITEKELEEEINKAGLQLTNKENNKNNQKINAWLKENHPNIGEVKFFNDKETGIVTVNRIWPQDVLDKIEKDRIEAMQRQTAMKKFFDRVKTPSGNDALMRSIENRLDKDFPYDNYSVSVTRSKSSARSLSFYVDFYDEATDNSVTIKISDHNTTWQEQAYGDTYFVDIHDYTSTDDLYNKVKGIINSKTKTDNNVRYSIEAPTFYSQMSRKISDIKQDKLGANSVVSYLKGRGVKDDEIKWSGIETFLDGKKSVTKEELQEFASGSMLNIEEKTLGYNKELLDDTFKKLIESNGDKYEGYEPNGNDSWVILSTLKDGTKDRWVVDGEELWEEYFDAETQSKWSKQLTNWKEYKLSGGSNYRELLFKMPNADYSNHAMEVHWGEQGVLAHARIQDMRTIEGQDMLFIEEIQSDWHNAGNKEGYVDKSKMLTVKNTEMKHEDGWYSLYRNGEELHQGVSDEYIKQRFRNGITDEEIHKSLVDEYNEVAVARNNGVDLVPDAPFKNNYTDYVIKRLLRMASEGGYDSIGWTTAKQQEERWSSQYAEGYRIEYDQDIPKFLNKYGKKWDGKVDKTELKNGEEVWQFVIPQSMKESVVRDGQPMYQLDSEYMSLANDPTKNEARLRELVDEAAKNVGAFNIDGQYHFYHGSKSSSITVFGESRNSSFGNYKFGNDNVNYFTSNKNNANSYTKYNYIKDEIVEGKVYDAFLMINNPYYLSSETDTDNKTSFNIQNKGIRKIQVKIYEDMFDSKKHFNKYFAGKSIEEVNEYLKALALEIRKEDEYFSIYRVPNNSMFNREGYIGSVSTEIGDLFDEEKESIYSEVFGENENDYYLTTDDIVNIVLVSNKHYGTDYDGIVIKDIFDAASLWNTSKATDVITIKSANQVKSADLITYDDNGNIIPLSQRFRSSNNDIRYSLDDRYERKQRYVDRLMKENAKSSKLTEEQHKVLADVARMRHELHVGKDDLWNPNSGEYEKLWGYIDSGINDELKSVGLKPIDFGINTDSVPSVEDFNLLGYDEDYEDINDWFENGEQYKEFIFTMEEINRKIEKYLQNIDEENGTKYAPTGYSRMYSLDETRYMEDTNSIYQKAYARQDKAFRKTDIDNMVSDVYKAWNDAFGGGISISGASNMLYNTFNSFWKGTKQDSISEVRDIFFSNMRLNGERLTEAQKETMASYQDALTRSMYEKYGNETPIGKANSQIKEDREQMRESMQKAKEEQETMKNYVSLRLMTESLKELSKRKYVGAGTVVDDQMQTIAQMFSKIISKGQIDPTATREAMKLYDEFYKKALEYVVDSDEFVSRFLPEIGDAIHGIAIGEGALSSAEIKDTTTILKNLRTIYSQDNQIIVNGKKLVATETATKEIHAESKYLAHKNSRTGRFQKTIQGLDKIRNSFVYQGITPIQVVRSLEFYDSHGYLTQMFEDIMRGRAKSSADYANIMRPINDFIDDTKGFEKHMIKDVIKYQGHEMTIGQAMALYMTSKRPEAELTLTETGFTYEYKGEKIHCGANTIEGIQGEIHSQFTEDDKQYIKLLETALDECRALKTDTDLAYYGFTNVSNGYYFPMSRDRMTIRSEVSNLKDMFKNIQTVTSKSFNKNLAQGAKNELYIDDASIVVERHTRGVSDYANLVIPFNTWDRVWNRTVEIGGNKTTVRQFVNEKVWTSKTHDAADKYFTKLFADIQGVRNPPTLSDKVFNYLRASYVSSALGLNLSSILKQTGSFGTASLYVDWKYLLRAIPMRADFNQMWKYSDVANGRMFQRAILQGEGNVDKTIMNNRFLKKATEVTGYGVEWMDRQVVGRIWNALKLQEAEILGKDTESEEVLKEAGKKLDQVINDTQSTATADTRSGFQRDTNPLMSTFTMFTSDAVKQCSNIFDAMSRLTYAGMRKKMGIGSDAEVKEAQKFALRQAGSFLAAITITVAIIQIIKSLLHKERKDNLGVDIASDYLGEAIGILPFVNQAYSLMADGYEVNSFVFDDFNDAVTSVTGIYGVLSKVAQGEDIDSYEVGRPLKKAANTIGNIFGIPVRNVTNYTTGILKTVSPSAGYELDSFFKQTSLSSDLNEAIENGKDKTAQKIIELALKKNGNDSTLASEILELMKNGESVSSVISTSSSSSETKTRSQVKTYKSVMSKADAQAEKMTISDTYAELTNEEKASALNSLYSRYKQTASYKAYGGDLDMSSAYSLLANQSTVAPIVARIKTIEADNSHSKSENVTTYLNSLSISNDEKFVALYQSGYRSNSVKEQMVAIIKRSSLTDAEKQTLIKSLE